MSRFVICLVKADIVEAKHTDIVEAKHMDIVEAKQMDIVEAKHTEQEDTEQVDYIVQTVLGDPLAPGIHSCGGSVTKMIVFWNHAMTFAGMHRRFQTTS